MSLGVENREVSDKARFLMWAGAWVVYGGLALGFYKAMEVLKARHAGFGAAMTATAIFLIAMFCVYLVLMRFTGKYSACAPSPAMRRYRRRQMVSFGAYVVLLFVTIWARIGAHLTGPEVVAIAVLPSLPLVGMIAALGLYFRDEMDEFQRTVQMYSALWATGGTLSIASVWGFLEMFANVQHLAGWVWFPVWWSLFPLANLLVRRRFQ